MLVEHVRNVLGFRGAGHEEFDPDAEHLAVGALACSLAGEDHLVRFRPGSLVADVYGQPEAVEPFRCSYGLNEDFRGRLEDAGLAVTGVDEDGGARVVELPGHPFFLATLYVPQARASAEPHPLVSAFVAAARRFGMSGRGPTPSAKKSWRSESG